MISKSAKLSACMLLLPFSGLAANAETAPEGLVEEAAEQATIFLEDGDISDNEARSIAHFLDVERIARFALGQHVRSMSESQYDAYILTFSRYLQAQLKDHLGQYGGGDINIESAVERSSSDVIVETSIAASDGEDMDVNWRVRKRDGEWGIVDVEAMGLWLAIEQRAQFTAKLDANGGDIDALISEIDTLSEN